MPVHSVRDLGIYVDSDVSMRFHVAKTISSYFAILRRIRSIHQPVTMPVLQSLMVSLEFTRLDYSSATLAGLLHQLLGRLQSVMNAAARLFFGSTIMSLRFCAIFTGCVHRKVANTVWRRWCPVSQGMNPSYLSSELQHASDVFPYDTCGHQRRHWSCLNR